MADILDMNKIIDFCDEYKNKKEQIELIDEYIKDYNYEINKSSSKISNYKNELYIIKNELTALQNQAYRNSGGYNSMSANVKAQAIKERANRIIYELNAEQQNMQNYTNLLQQADTRYTQLMADLQNIKTWLEKSRSSLNQKINELTAKIDVLSQSINIMSSHSADMFSQPVKIQQQVLTNSLAEYNYHLSEAQKIIKLIDSTIDDEGSTIICKLTRRK